MSTKIIAIATSLGFVVVAICYCLPHFQLVGFKPDPDKPNDRIRLENELRTSNIQMVGGFLVLGGLFFGYRNLKTLQDGQLTERFTRAVDQLGNNDFSIRLGGFLSLEGIARESKRDHRAVMELLSAYAQAHSNDLARRGDIQAVMRVIGRRNVKHDESSGTLNLDGVNLSDLDLRKANYEQVSFVRARFSGAKLAEARFDRADLHACDFDRAELWHAVFDKANLSRASFSQASLFQAKLRDADLSGAVLKGASLWKSDLTKTNFTGARLGGSFLLQATLKGTNIRGADLSGAVVLLQQLTPTKNTPLNPPDSAPSGPRVRRTPEGRLGIMHDAPKTLIGEDSPVKPSEFLEVYCEGLGELRGPKSSERSQYPRTVVEPRVTIDGNEVFVDYAGVAPATPAGYQINLQVPGDLSPGKHLLKIEVGDVASEEIEIVSGPLALTS
jgi:uncharacterized protein YjbI with pentapeptide repeats